jgi:ectoine hydroxylase-related dioxygenase (phytanoyl-CoA dioxygenase family)
MYAEQNVFTYNWRKGDLLIWDNLTMQHARPDLKADAPARTLRKTLVPAYMVEAANAPSFKASYKRVGD